MRLSTIGRGRHSALMPALLASTVLAGLPLAAHAADTSGGLEEVVVTAQKIEENLQKVPLNINAISSEQLSQLHLNSFTDFELYLPSVTYAVSGQGSNGGPGFSNITMRGVASDQNGNHSGPLPTVGVYFDEQPISTINGTLDIPAYDIARVEALSGPQGTLYGASSESGTIRIISNKPDPTRFSAAYDASVNTVEHGGIGYQLQGYVNEPLSDKMAVRIVGWEEHDAGYIDNVHVTRTYPTSGITIDNSALVKKNYNTVDKLGGRAALEIDLDSNWTVTPSIMVQSERTNGIFGADSSLFSPAAAAAANAKAVAAGAAPGTTIFNSISNYGNLEVGHFVPEYVHDNWYQAALTVQGKIGNFDVLYAGGYMNRTIHSQADYSDYAFWYDTLHGSGAYFTNSLGNTIDPTQIIHGKDNFTKNSQELRFVSPKNARLRVVGGLFYEDQTHHILQDYQVAGNFAPALSVPGWPGSVWLTDQIREDQDYAAFVDVNYDILPNLTLNGGIRGFYADNSLEGFFGFGAGFASYGQATCFAGPIVNNSPCTDLKARVTESGETHKVNLTWQVTGDKMVYATYSTGFRPGGVNRRNDIPGVGPYSSDSLDNYELGWKTSWDDNRLRVNGDVFWENWNNFQYPYLGPNSVTIISNVGSATIKGLESNIEYLPIDSLTLSAAVAWTDAMLSSDYCGGVCGTINPKTGLNYTVQSPNGTQLPITPRWKMNAVARYEFTLWGLNSHVQGSLVHQSGTWSDLRIVERGLLGKNQAFTLVDFSTGIGRDDWNVELSVKNAFDERAQLGRYSECAPGTCGYQTYILPAQPRTIAITWSKKFE